MGFFLFPLFFITNNLLLCVVHLFRSSCKLLYQKATDRNFPVNITVAVVRWPTLDAIWRPKGFMISCHQWIVHVSTKKENIYWHSMLNQGRLGISPLLYSLPHWLQNFDAWNLENASIDIKTKYIFCIRLSIFIAK